MCNCIKKDKILPNGLKIAFKITKTYVKRLEPPASPVNFL